MCGRTSRDCLEAIGEQFLAVGSVLGKIAGIVTSAGASAGGNLTAEAIKTSALNAMKAAAKTAAKNLLGISATEVKNRIIKDLKKNPKILMTLSLSKRSPPWGANPEAFNYTKFLTGLDPTGIAHVVEAFNKEICH